MTDTLYPYQHVGITYLCDHKRVLLGDDRGLGKTVQAIRAVSHLPLLIVCSQVMQLKWRDEIMRWRPEWTDKIAVVNQGETSQRQTALRTNPLITIVNYEMLRGQRILDPKTKKPLKTYIPRFPEIVNRKWSAVIIDEAHHMKSRDAQQTKGAMKLQSQELFLLTANPITSSPEDLWTMLHLLAPQQFRGFHAWADEFCRSHYEMYKTSTFPTKIIDGWRDPVSVQQLLVGRYIRRTKEEVLPELPPKIIIPVPVKLTVEERRRYLEAEKLLILELANNDFQIIPSAMVATGRLRQLLSGPNAFGHPVGTKQLTTCDIVEELLETESSILVFGCYHATVNGLKEELVRRKVPARIEVITGDTPKSELYKVRQDFQDPERTHYNMIILGTIGSLGEGVDLYRARSVIFVEQDWVPDNNTQAMDRVHRIGQTFPVNVYEIFAEHTVDATVQRVLKERREMIDQVWVTSQVMRERFKEIREV